jgi:hypothetical protein
MKGYVVLPASWRSDAIGARGWIRGSLAFTAALPAKEPKKSKGRR